MKTRHADCAGVRIPRKSALFKSTVGPPGTGALDMECHVREGMTMRRRYWIYRDKDKMFLGAITVRDWAAEMLRREGYTLTLISGGH